MKAALVFIALFFALAAQASVPALLWSGEADLLQAAPDGYVLQRAPASAIVDALSATASGQLAALNGPLAGLLSPRVPAPEVIVAYVMKQLSTSQLSRAAAAYDAEPAGGSFKPLRDAMQSSASQAILPATQPSSGDAPVLSALLASKMAPSVLRVPQDVSAADLLARLSSHDATMFHNKQTELLLVEVGSDEESMSVLSDLQAAVARGTQGSFLSLFSADAQPAQPAAAADGDATEDMEGAPSPSRRQLLSTTTEAVQLSAAVGLAGINATPTVVMSLLVVLLFLFAAYCGITCSTGIRSTKGPYQKQVLVSYKEY